MERGVSSKNVEFIKTNLQGIFFFCHPERCRLVVSSQIRLARSMLQGGIFMQLNQNIECCGRSQEINDDFRKNFFISVVNLDYKILDRVKLNEERAMLLRILPGIRV